MNETVIINAYKACCRLNSIHNIFTIKPCEQNIKVFCDGKQVWARLNSIETIEHEDKIVQQIIKNVEKILNENKKHTEIMKKEFPLWTPLKS